jgi:hypothetical protein
LERHCHTARPLLTANGGYGLDARAEQEAAAA